MIQDLHSHTRYSNCGRDEPALVVEAAIQGGIELLGVSDHNYGIGDRKARYLAELDALRARYAGKIRILRGIEIATIPAHFLKPGEDLSAFDYCLVEHLDDPTSMVGARICAFADTLGIPTGIAHTDLFGWMNAMGVKPEEFLRALAAHGVFWERNVNYDSIHGYREHAYVKAFMESPEQQRMVRDAGLRVSVGFDGHRVEDYLPGRVVDTNSFLEAARIPRPFEE